jgi:hypothetical protein
MAGPVDGLPPPLLQRHDQVVEVAGWRVDEDFGIFPVGSKPKRLLRCPAPPPQPFLIPGHAYLFKIAVSRRVLQQLWSEFIAYRIAAMIGVVVLVESTLSPYTRCAGIPSARARDRGPPRSPRRVRVRSGPGVGDRLSAPTPTVSYPAATQFPTQQNATDRHGGRDAGAISGAGRPRQAAGS